MSKSIEELIEVAQQIAIGYHESLLSDDEVKILSYFLQDLTYDQIAARIDFAIPTIKKKSKALSAKLSPNPDIKVTKKNAREFLEHFSIKGEDKSKSDIDLAQAPSVSFFVGREKELAQLEHWIVEDRCRLVLLMGVGGIGKTALAVKLVERVQQVFDCCIWLSLREAPRFNESLVHLLSCLSNQQEKILHDNLGENLSLLSHYLTQSRCLLVLDNAESLLETGTKAGKFQLNYEDYGALLKRLGEGRHQSCLLLTSREKPDEVALMEGENAPVRVLNLKGLEESNNQELLRAFGLNGSIDQCRQVFQYFDGNPLALRIVAIQIHDLFNDDIDFFLDQESHEFSEISDLLNSQFERLSDLEKLIMYWLAVSRDGVDFQTLQDDIIERTSKGKILAAIQSLKKRCLVEVTGKGFTLQNVILENLTDRLVNEVIREIKSQNICLLNKMPLLQATKPNYIKEAQTRLLLKPVIDQLFDAENFLLAVIDKIHSTSDFLIGYAAGNVFNLACKSGLDLRRFDFSNLELRYSL